MKNDIYKECPIYTTDKLSLRLTSLDDTKELLKCYSDEKAVPFFNSDNCNGDDFYYTTLERMEEAIKFWQFSYENRYFVRLTVVLNETKEKIGTIEIFNRQANDDFNNIGVLRIDLQSKCEKKQYIDEILDIANEYFYDAFGVKTIITKAISEATERIYSLKNKGYVPLNKKFMIYDDYFVREA